ncbi:hypothetical protein EMCRGX_G025106 [Ephydatia muelleri]
MEQGPAVEQPGVEQGPAVEQPGVEQGPAELAVEQGPAVEQPGVEQGPAELAVEQGPAVEQPGVEQGPAELAVEQGPAVEPGPGLVAGNAEKLYRRLKFGGNRIPKYFVINELKIFDELVEVFVVPDILALIGDG